MPDIRKLLLPFSNLFTQKQLIQLTRSNIFLPFYHTVADQKLPHIQHLYKTRSTQEFTKDLEYLCNYFRPVSIQELYEVVIDKKQIETPVFHLTFDDGLSEVFHVIAPILEQKGIPATIFLNSGFMDNKELFYRYKVSLLVEKLMDSSAKTWTYKNKSYQNKQELIADLKAAQYKDIIELDLLATILGLDFNRYLEQNKPYLSTSQIHSLLNRGFTFGAHSIDHPMFSEISFEEQQRQVSLSLKAVNAFGINEKYFSFPFNDQSVGRAMFQWLYKEEQCALSFGVSGLKHDEFSKHLHRIPMEGSNLNAQQLIKAEYFYYLMKSMIGKNKISRG